MNRVGHAFIKHRMRKEDAVFAGEVSAHYYFRDFSQATPASCRSCSWSSCSRAGDGSWRLLAPYRDRFFLTGEINTPVADVALKLQELKERRAGRAHLAPRRYLRRLRRLALQRPPLEHRAAAAPEPRGALAGVMEEKRDEVLELIRA